LFPPSTASRLLCPTAWFAAEQGRGLPPAVGCTHDIGQQPLDLTRHRSGWGRQGRSRAAVSILRTTPSQFLLAAFVSFDTLIATDINVGSPTSCSGPSPQPNLPSSGSAATLVRASLQAWVLSKFLDWLAYMLIRKICCVCLHLFFWSTGVQLVSNEIREVNVQFKVSHAILLRPPTTF
jgi:hypothetical protein